MIYPPMTRECAAAIVALGKGEPVDPAMIGRLKDIGWATRQRGKWIATPNAKALTRAWLVKQIEASKPRATANPITSKTTLVTKVNPSKPGTQAHVLYELMRKGRTMKRYVELAQEQGIGASVARYYATWFLGRAKISIK